MSRLVRGVAATALAGAAWATLIEPRLFTIRRHTLPMLAEGAAPIRVLQLSDLHLAPWQHQKIAWVRRLVELKPDLVVLTGDLMGHRAARGPLLHALQPLAEAGVPGVFVHGSNDYYGPIPKNPLRYLAVPSRKSTRTPDIDNAALTTGLISLGFHDLNNDAVRVTLRGSDVELFGLGDPHIRYDRSDRMEAARAALPARPAESPNLARIGVVHAPYQSALGTLLRADADVILAGHTHGGQVRLPGVGALTSNCDLPPRLARGLDVWFNADRAAYLNVSAGLGASIYAPVRFACRPEASLLTLESPR